MRLQSAPIVDCDDALTSERSCRRELSHADALEVIAQRGGSMCDPFIAEVFLRTMAVAPLRDADAGGPTAFPDTPQHASAPLSNESPHESRA